MILEEVLQSILERVEICGIEYMMTGSFAGNLYGVPRATQDADIVIVANENSLHQFVSSLQNEFYADSSMALRALEEHHMFNVVHLNSGFKVDFIVRKQREYSQEKFRRRRKAIFFGRERWFASPEDIILTKLEWSKMGESEKQFTDAVNIAKVQKLHLDREYLKKWATELNVTDLLNKLFQNMTII